MKLFKRKEQAVTTPVPAMQVTQTTQQEDVQKPKEVHFVTKLIFWLAFVSLLATTIPHVAWLYHEYEQGETTIINLGFTSVDFWWLVSYGVAISIDVLVAWLSFVKILGKSRTDDNVTWVFIGLLCALSWYCNYLYAMAHNPMQQIDIWSISLLGGLTTTGSITPVIVSAIPVFVVAYTFMFSKLASTTQLSSKELAAIASELEAVTVQKARIKSVKRRALVGSITGLVDSAKDVVQHTKEAVTSDATSSQSTQVDTVEESVQSLPVYTVTPIPVERNTGPIAAINGHSETQVLEIVHSGTNGHTNGIPVYTGVAKRKNHTNDSSNSQS